MTSNVRLCIFSSPNGNMAKALTPNSIKTTKGRTILVHLHFAALNVLQVSETSEQIKQTEDYFRHPSLEQPLAW